jgi:DNA polymerase-3 subunit delta
MKLAAKDVDRAFKTLSQDQYSILAYGPDTGGVRDMLKRAEAAISGGKDIDPLSKIHITPDALSADPAKLYDEAAQQAFFGGPKIIHVGPVTDTHAATLASIVEDDLPAYVLIEAGNLPPKSKVRKLFESAKKAYAIACYLDAERDIDQLIDTILAGNGVRVSRDARLFLRSQLGNDRSVTRQELEKVALYAGAGIEGEAAKSIELEDVRALIGANAAETTDDIAAAAFSGLGDKADHLLGNALREETNGVEIVRALARRCLRLITAAHHVESGKTQEEAVKALRPPVFWKDKGAFSAQLSRWKLSRLEACLSLIVQAETTLKGQGPSPESTLGRLVMQIAMAGRRGG